MKLDYKWLLILLLTFLLVLSTIDGCKYNPGSSDTIRLTDTTWKIDSQSYPVYTPGPTKVLPGDTQWLNKPIDTAALLKDYYCKRIYNDTFKIDSIGYAIWTDTVTTNRIVKINKSYKYKIPVINNTTIINNYYKQPRQINVTGLVDIFNPTIYGGLLYESRKDIIYHVNLGFGINGPSLIGGISFPILQEPPILK